MSELYQTTLLELTLEQGGELANFYSWEMARHFGDLAHEQSIVANECGVIDHGCYARFQLQGDKVIAELNQLLALSILELPVGGAMNNVMLSNLGKIIGSITLLRMAEDDCLIMVHPALANGVFERLDAQLSGDIALEDLSDNLTQFAIIGNHPPKEIELPAENQWSYVSFGEAKAIATRSGIGCEFIVNAQKAEEVYSTILNELELEPVGFEAEDFWRIANHQPECGSEIIPNKRPEECGLMDLISKVGNREFAGSIALKKGSAESKLYFAKCDGRKGVRIGCPVRINSKRCGFVTSATFDYQNSAVLVIISLPCTLQIIAGDGILIETEKSAVAGKIELL